MSPFEQLRERSTLSESESDQVRYAVRADIDGAGGAKVIAGLMGRGLSTVYGWSETCEEGNKFHDVARLVKLLGNDGRLARVVASLAGGTYVPNIAPDDSGDVLMTLRNASEVMRFGAKLADEVIEAVEDNSISKPEAARILSAVEELDVVVEMLRLVAKGAGA